MLGISLIMLGISTRILYLAQVGYNLAITQLKQARDVAVTQRKQGRWLRIEPPEVTFPDPGTNKLVFTFKIRNLLRVEAKSVMFDTRVVNFDSIAEWRQMSEPPLPRHLLIPLIKGLGWFKVTLSLGVAAANPKEHYCGGGPGAKKAHPIFVRLLVFWQDSNDNSYRQGWTFKGRCVMGPHKKTYEQQKFKLFLYLAPTDWFGGGPAN